MSTSIVEVVNVAREVSWLPWAVQYFFLIGLSVGCFLLTMPWFALRRPAWERASRLALLGALACGLTAPVALLADLHQPGRFLNFYLHPNFGSWMAWGAFFIPLYLGGLALYTWLILRPDLKRLADAGGRWAGVYRAFAYGGHDSLGAIRIAAVLALTGAALVALYTGMEVMVVHARPLWDTPLLPVQFFITAVAGAIGLVLVLDRAIGDGHAAQGAHLLRLLAATQILVLAVGAAWLLLGVTGLSPTHANALAQVAPSSAWQITAVWAAGSAMVTLWLAVRHPAWRLAAGLIALHSAWMMRWTVFIGGQEIPKTGAGYYHDYHLPLGQDGMLGILGTAGLWIAVLIILISVLPWAGQRRVQA
ncbi:tetrathionate reductase subunit C [Sulfuriferula multivorans]|uniref:Tetrathionate reductase subunit C n=1 Tax=Sulfuriferula multivorans TaxID=1559896 RepID=A0A401JEM6_9PROT|nr:NrfD/PsrC family molybdoenzyme membrane anchor subunit [Sulfuriferula multivorans]GBL46087.1 tetrathionate reductase subunit C [Sulfuriferula multivorans]